MTNVTRFIDISESEKDRMVVDYLGGFSIMRVAAKHGVWYRWMRDVLIARSVPIRPRRKYSMDLSFFETIDSHEKAQVLGFIWADGCLLDGSGKTDMPKIGITLAMKDRGYLEWLSRQMRSTYPLRERVHSSGRRYVGVQINDPKPVRDIRKLGIYPRKSLTIGFPTHAQVPSQFVHSFVRGVFEGDGCIHLKRGNAGSGAVALFCATMEFNVALQKILSSAGIDSVIDHPKQAQGRNWCKLNVTRLGSIFRLHEWMYRDASYSMSRKRVLFEQLRSRYDSDGKLIETDEWKERRRLALARVRSSWTLSEKGRLKMRDSQAKRMKRSFVSFYVKAPDGTIYFGNVISDFAREMGLNVGSFHNFVSQRQGVMRYKGWTHPTELEAEAARTNGVLVERLYRQSALAA